MHYLHRNWMELEGMQLAVETYQFLSKKSPKMYVNHTQFKVKEYPINFFHVNLPLNTLKCGIKLISSF